MRRLPRLTMWQPTLTFTTVVRSAGGLSTFSCVVSLSSSARLCTCLLLLRSKHWRAYVFRYCVTVAETEVRVRVRWRIVTVHVQRGQIRVVSVVATDEPTGRPHSAAAFLFMSPLSWRRIKELNLTSSRLLRFTCPVGGWHGFLLHRRQDLASTSIIDFTVGGLLRASAACAARLRLSLSLRSRGGAQPLWAAQFSSSRFALLCIRLSPRCGNRCRNRGSRSRAMAH